MKLACVLLHNQKQALDGKEMFFLKKNLKNKKYRSVRSKSYLNCLGTKLGTLLRYQIKYIISAS